MFTKINFQTILQTIAFWKIEKYCEELNINFASDDIDIRQKFECDFIIAFVYDNKYLCYCIVQNPQENPKITAITVHGHFLYQGDSFFDAIGRVAALYGKNLPV